jgi:hypothetical protein
MLKKTGWLSAGLVLAAFSAVASGSVGSAQAAVVYCKTAGVPQRLRGATHAVATAAVVTPAVGVARVGVTRVGVARVGARGVGVRPATPLNRGGPVNRVGRR